MSRRTPGLPTDDPFRIGTAPFSREEAIAILCRVVARWCEDTGCEGDAVACRLAEHVLLTESKLCARCRRDLDALRVVSEKP